MWSIYAIDVVVRARQKGEKLKIDFPCEKKAAVAAFVELVWPPGLPGEFGSAASMRFRYANRSRSRLSGSYCRPIGARPPSRP